MEISGLFTKESIHDSSFRLPSALSEVFFGRLLIYALPASSIVETVPITLPLILGLEF